MGPDKRAAQLNPNSIRSYKIVQKLSPKHAARGIAQSPYPTYRHGKARLSKQPPWRAAGDPRLARRQVPGSSPGPGGRAARASFLHPPFLPPSGDRFFFFFSAPFPTKAVRPVVRLGLMHATPLAITLTLLDLTKSYKNSLQNTQHAVLRNRPTLPIGTERLACLNSPCGVQLVTLA